jgi:hypothetical protein
MIIRFLAKVVIAIVVVGLAAVELGAPLVTRFQLDGVANDAAGDAALTLFQTRDVNQSRLTAEQVVSRRDATFHNFQVDETGAIRVTVGRQAPSLLLKKWDRLKSWYDVRATSTATRKES